MSLQNWIYDPPPPAPKKAVSGNVKAYNSQVPLNARGTFRKNNRENGQRQNFGRGRTNNWQQPNRQNGIPISPYHPVYPRNHQQLNQAYPTPTFEPPMSGSPANIHHHSSQQQYHPYPPPQYPQQPLPLSPSQLAVYQTPPQTNIYGYTFSSTAFSLQASQDTPHPSERPDLSEEELRYKLEQQMKKVKPRYLFICGDLLTKSSHRRNEHYVEFCGGYYGVEGGAEEEMVE